MEPGLDEYFQPGGVIARAHRRFEFRPEQLEMARTVQRAFLEKRPCLVEAGTGVGKSFAYAIPALLHARSAKMPVVISTATKNLQEQLFARDLPFLKTVMPFEFVAALVKGRGNYLCRRRLDRAVQAQSQLFESDESRALAEIVEWAGRTRDGSLEDFEEQPPPGVWDEVCAESGNCLGKQCQYFKDQCFYQNSRRRIWGADVLVVNHHLLFADLALKALDSSLLPRYRTLIIDEAHEIEDIAQDAFGIDLSYRGVRWVLSRLYADDGRRQRGTLAKTGWLRERELVAAARIALDGWFDLIESEFFDNAEPPRAGSFRPGIPRSGVLRGESLRDALLERKTSRCSEISKNLDERLPAALERLAHALQKRSAELDDRDFELAMEVRRRTDRLVALAAEARAWMTQESAEAVYWVERSQRRARALRLRSAPLWVSEHLRRHLFEPLDAVVLTSATLACGAADFRFVIERLGVPDPISAQLGSPFDYQSQVALHIPRGMPSPEDNAAYERGLVEHLWDAVQRTEGRALCLFTSYQTLERTRVRLQPLLAAKGYTLLWQHSGANRSLLLQRFQATPRCVLLGTASFWQGIDVPGAALSNVIITRLPFSVPGHPLREARDQAMREGGRNPFNEAHLPEAILRFRQGFGRLVRSKEDRGLVFVLDSRVLTKYYGKRFLDALPRCAVITEGERPAFV